MTTVVNIRTDECDVYIGRVGCGQDGYWGNPFSIGKDGDRSRVLALYLAYFNNRIIDDPEFFRRLQGLIGKRLGCFCVPERCHGHIMADYLNIESKVKPRVDKLISAGFSTFSSCDGGEGHAFGMRTIRLRANRPTVDYQYGSYVKEHDRKAIFVLFELLLDFVEKQGWTYCTPKICWPYNVVRLSPEKRIPSPFFELEWN